MSSSFERIVSYFHALASEDFVWNDKKVETYAELTLSPLIFRSYTCPSGCGACCLKGDLVWDQPSDLAESSVVTNINGVEKVWYTYTDKNEGRFCDKLDSDGRCTVYSGRPLHCKLELFKFVHHVKRDRALALVRLPGRGFQLTRVDAGKGAKCEIVPFDLEMTKTHIHDLMIFKSWMDEYHIANHCQAVISYIESGPHEEPLRLVNRNIL